MRGNPVAITRDKDFRTKFAAFVPRDMLSKIVNNNVDDYIESIYNSLQKVYNAMDDYRVFEMACEATLNKYGVEQLMTALLMGINGNYGYFTNGGEMRFREKLMRIPPETFRKYANEYLKILKQQQEDEQHRGR